MRGLISVIVVLLLFFPVRALADDLKFAKPHTVSMSEEKLDKINQLFRRKIEEGEIVGGVTMVARRGRIVHVGLHGMADRENNIPMTSKTIFRLASNSKLIASIGALVALDEGKFSLGDPVSQWIPALKRENLRVMVPGDEDPTRYEIVPAVREMTILDSLTMRTGLSYYLLAEKIPPESPLWLMWQAVPEYFSFYRQNEMTLEKALKIAAGLPLLNQPGGDFNYGSDLHVVARVCEVIYNQTFDEYLKDKVLNPLGMKDTRFYYPRSDAARAAALYEMTPVGLKRMEDGEINRNFSVDIQPDWLFTQDSGSYFPPGEGLGSTPEDYMRLLLMLQNGGEYRGKRILESSTIDAMRKDYTAGACCPHPALPPHPEGAKNHWGLGSAVVAEGNEEAMKPLSKGSYFWYGWFGNYWWVDPSEELNIAS